MSKRWNTKKAADLYRIHKWGLGYFTINEDGNVCAKPSAESLAKVDLKLLVDELCKRKINPPILIRFMDILKDRIRKISDCFQEAIAANEYRGKYFPLFPIKVNQERDVVSSILKYGKQQGVGLEAGSKAELLIVLALTIDPLTPIVCNGYKDQEFVELVGMAHKIGKHIIPVLENYIEVETFIRHYKKTGIMPSLGVRIKLSTNGSGKWAKTGGDSSKFGLRIPEVMMVVARLKEEGLIDCLKLLHFHVGSQISEIKVVKQAIVESSRVYVEIAKLGAKMEYLDIGGGLGVDYNGSSPDHYTSINYSVEEYASDIVYRIKQQCDANGIQHPTIFSESGRFISAHYSMLVTNVPIVDSVGGEQMVPAPTDHEYGPLKEMAQILENMEDGNVLECYHDAIQYKSEAQDLFNLGYISLPERAYMEQLFWQIMQAILLKSKRIGLQSAELKDLEYQLADTYFANFSLFQSLPDSWAIDQVFPIIPIHRLNECPDKIGVIVDLTCDSDGLIKSYIGEEECELCLPLHSLQDSKPYYLGIFLVGAYQETLGELHNLFGDTHAVQVELLGENQYRLHDLIKGDTIGQVIGFVSYNYKELIQKMRSQVESAVEAQKLTLDESAHMMDQFEEGLSGYTYFED